MFVIDKINQPQLGLSGFDAELSEEELAIQASAHRFAEEVMRPIGEKLDKMTPEEVVAPDSPIWDFLKQIRESGLLDLEMLGSMSNQEKGRILPILLQELGWGDAGLTIVSMVTSFPAFMAHASGNPELVERFGDKIGCWLGTQPDRGSDVVDYDASEIHPGAQQNRGNLHARVEGNEVVINGQSSAWVTAAPLAECALAYMGCDYGDGLFHENGSQNLISILIPFDLDGVSKGKPLDKIGQRPLPQGEIFFDEVRVPIKYALSKNGEEANASLFGAVTFANMEMSITFTGLARAAYEHALAYCHERKQGGVPIIQHQSVRMRLFDMWRKLEACQALMERVCKYNFSAKGPHLVASITSKTFVTQSAFEIASEALQLFGGNGLTKEYPLEKLLRDARAALIEDGENNILSLKGMSMLSGAYREKMDL